MSNQPQEKSKPETKPEKKTDATAILSPDELRAIAGGGGVPKYTPSPNDVTKTRPTG